MKKNLLWMLVALFACSVMTTSCGDDEEIVPIDNQGQNQGNQGNEKPVYPVSLQVKYEASAPQNIMANYNLVGSQVLVRYVDADGKIKSEPFTGSFSKTLTIPITSTGVNAAFQVLIVLKNKEEIEFGEGIDVTTDMKFTWNVNFDDNSKSEEFVFTTTNGYCNARPTLTASNYDNYASTFGGFVPAMTHIGYYAEQTADRTSYDGPKLLAASFWRENAFTAAQ